MLFEYNTGSSFEIMSVSKIFTPIGRLRWVLGGSLSPLLIDFVIYAGSTMGSYSYYCILKGDNLPRELCRRLGSEGRELRRLSAGYPL